jgi:hypothetical protein
VNANNGEDGFYFDHEDDATEDAQPTQQPTKEPAKRSGRPAGAKNRDRASMSLLTTDKLEKLYNRVTPYLPLDERKYIRGVINGTQGVDPKREMELLVRQCSIIFSEASVYYWNEGKVSRDLAAFADTLRGAIKDLYDIQLKEQEINEKDDDIASIKAADRRKMEAQVNELLGIEG